MAQLVKNLPAIWETGLNPWVGKTPLEKGKTPHSSVLGLENSMDCTAPGVAKSENQPMGSQSHLNLTKATRALNLLSPKAELSLIIFTDTAVYANNTWSRGVWNPLEDAVS